MLYECSGVSCALWVLLFRALVMMTVWATPTAVLVHSLATMLQVWLLDVMCMQTLLRYECAFMFGASCGVNAVGGQQLLC
jgi:hypothetical protein